MVLGVLKQKPYGTWSVEITSMWYMECLNKKHMVLGVSCKDIYGTWSFFSKRCMVIGAVFEQEVYLECFIKKYMVIEVNKKHMVLGVFKQEV